MKFHKDKRGAVYVDSVVKIIISLLVGAVVLAICTGLIAEVVLPTTNSKIQTMFNTEPGKLANISGGGPNSSGNAFDDGVCHLKYYLTLEDAIADANIGSTEHENATEETAGARIDIRQKDGVMIVRPLSDYEITQSIDLSGDYTLDLNGKNLTINTSGVQFNLTEGANITLRDSCSTDIEDPEASVGSITKTTASPSGSATETIFDSETGSAALIVLNGKYSATDTNAGAVMAFYAEDSSAVDVKSAKVEVNTASGAAYGVYAVRADYFNLVQSKVVCSSTNTGGLAVWVNGTKDIMIDNSVIQVRGKTLKTTYGMRIQDGGFIVVQNSTVYGYANSLQCNDKAYINNCTFSGGHSGLQTVGTGTVYINGGIFESCMHGGVYLAAQNNIVSNAHMYLKNFQDLQWYDFTRVTWGDNFHPSYTAGTKMGGSYIGNDKNIATYAYFDNCTFSGINPANKYSIVVSSNYNYRDTYLYLSNSTLEGCVRVDGKNVGNGACGHFYKGKNVTMGADVFFVTSANASASIYTDEPGVYDDTTYADTAFTQQEAEKAISLR